MSSPLYVNARRTRACENITVIILRLWLDGWMIAGDLPIVSVERAASRSILRSGHFPETLGRVSCAEIENERFSDAEDYDTDRSRGCSCYLHSPLAYLDIGKRCAR